MQFTGRNQVGLHTDALEHGYVGTQFLGILGRDRANETGLPKTALATYHFGPIAEIGITTQCQSRFNFIDVMHAHQATREASGSTCSHLFF